ncbi:50S ribosomal protein L23 [Sulfoacidibacillus thermotolerans]|uniref:Large ribosomal subunit protein uL23 n=1 Tax=Sulfoacidibacillus thermotolerans TaxID=1765684 RepID=A0A2U3DBF6_SULT2|nr:50S ribosomal protein L23 [Sulfoacidibacillus thermotolerans]PWI58619.1 50S ribosomal protein L23 [Sulfoacidibacillus thermotolerans]
MKNAHDIIRRPLVTEKSMGLAERQVYTFEVAGDANKIEIAKAVETVFPGVKVVKVNTMWVPAKRKRFGRHVGYTSKWKKAMVTLTEDSQQLDFFGQA